MRQDSWLPQGQVQGHRQRQQPAGSANLPSQPGTPCIELGARGWGALHPAALRAHPAPAPPPRPPCSLRCDCEQKKSGEEMANFYADLCSKYPIISIEVRIWCLISVV